MSEGKCLYCWYFSIPEEPRDDIPEGYGICKDIQCFERTNSIVDGNQTRTCYKTKTDIIFGRGKSFQMKLV